MRILLKLLIVYIVLFISFTGVYYSFWDNFCNKYSKENIFNQEESLYFSSECVNKYICKIDNRKYDNNVAKSWSCNKKDILWLENLYNNYGKN